MARDKILHFGVSLASTFVISLVSPTAGVAFTLGAGVGKEYGDSRALGNNFDFGDLLADCIGILAGLLFSVFMRSMV